MSKDTGLELLALYRNMVNGKHYSRTSNYYVEEFTDTTTPKGMARAVSLAIEREDAEEAQKLLNDWARSFPLATEDTTLFNYLIAQVNIEHYCMADNDEELAIALNGVIEAANDFFHANAANGHKMDIEAKSLWLNVTPMEDKLIRNDKVKHLLRVSLEMPDVEPDPSEPTRTEEMRNALRVHLRKFGYLGNEASHLLKCICSFSRDFDAEDIIVTID